VRSKALEKSEDFAVKLDSCLNLLFLSTSLKDFLHFGQSKRPISNWVLFPALDGCPARAFLMIIDKTLSIVFGYECDEECTNEGD
jgi:hypothetical protein